MKTCVRCEGLYTGRTRDDLCPVCLLRDRRRIRADARGQPMWSKRQLALRNALYRIETASAPRAAMCCAQCGRAFDDHAFTYLTGKDVVPLCKSPTVISEADLHNL